MSEHFSAGVKIILARIESHPEEFKEQFGKWEDIITSVRHHVAGETNHAYGMTEEEIKALHEKFREHIWVPQFNDMVMQRVLDPEKEARQEQHNLAQTKIYAGGGLVGQGKRVAHSWTDPRIPQNNMLQPGSVSPYLATTAEDQRRISMLERVRKAMRAK